VAIKDYVVYEQPDGVVKAVWDEHDGTDWDAWLSKRKCKLLGTPVANSKLAAIMYVEQVVTK
jgi:hypothetical protein